VLFGKLGELLPDLFALGALPLYLHSRNALLTKLPHQFSYQGRSSLSFLCSPKT
jgi:hypothetical protein